MKFGIDERSWHYALYTWWQRKSGFKKPPGFKENLCHYLRVVFFWVPLGWFFRQKVAGPLRPWQLVVLAGITQAIVRGLIYGFAHFPEAMIHFFGLIGLIVAIVLAIVLIAYLFARYEKVVQAIAIVVLFPLWAPILSVAFVILILWEKVITPIFFRRHSFLAFVWIGTLLTLAALIFRFWGLEGLRVTGVVLAIVACAIALIIITKNILPDVVRWIRYTLGLERRVRSLNDQTSATMGQLLRVYQRTKWGSIICPFIELPKTKRKIEDIE